METPRPRIVRRRPRCAPLPHLPPLLARVYAHRGVADASELEDGLAHLLPYHELKGIDEASDLLAETMARDAPILVVGDFDADGATASAVAVKGLRAMGARVDFLVPDRFRYGYGLTPAIVERAAERRPALLVTVDNGIASLAGVERAHELGMQVLVTDHHLAGERLPEAEAIVNPNQPGDPFPSKNLAGVGVIFYVLSALRARLRADDWFAHRGLPEPRLGDLLDLVALGTVADVVPLDHNNRILVSQGLKRVRAGRCSPGILALLEVAGRDHRRVHAADFGFVVGPRLNAAGRLEDMSIGIQCLLAPDLDNARPLAQRLDALNRERRRIEEEMKVDAGEQVEQLLQRGELPFGLCLFEPHWHQGVIGILASRVKERLHRPVIAFAPGENGEIKGSARSVPGVHIRDVLDAVATRHPGLLNKFGGHAMAAGLSLDADDLEAFQAAFDAEVRRHLAPEQLNGVIESDGPVSPRELTLENAEALRNGGPWGQAFPEPLFDDRFEVCQRRLLKDRHLKLTLRHVEGGAPLDAILFGYADHHDTLPDAGARVHATFHLDVNEYRDRRNLQLLLRHLFLD